MNDILVVSICILNSSAYQLRDVSDDSLKHVADLIQLKLHSLMLC